MDSYQVVIGTKENIDIEIDTTKSAEEINSLYIDSIIFINIDLEQDGNFRESNIEHNPYN